jgi:hypothetical protein
MLFSTIFRIRRKPAARRPHFRGAGFRPCVEALEERTVLSFFTAPAVPVGNGPVGQAVGDFNGDGHADLAVINQASNTVSVLLGNGDGTYQPKIDYATGAAPTGVVVADFNADGKLDLAVANFGANSVSVLLGNGDGTFRPRTDLAVSTTPVSLAVGDFNGDGKLDLAVATEDLANDYLVMLRGNGDGTFQVPLTTVTDAAPKGVSLFQRPYSTIRVGDFNGDGRLDAVVVNNKDVIRTGRGGGTFFFNGTVSVLLGNGDGTVQAPKNFAVGVSPVSVAVGDFNGDGRADFVVGNLESTFESVFMNTGGGNFSSSSIAPGGQSFSLAAGDFNGDGRTDLAVTAAVAVPGGDYVTVFTGQASGSLQLAAQYVTPFFNALTAVDLNGDGNLDLVGSVIGTSTISLMLNNGNGTFPAPFLISNPGVTLPSQASADFNGDGIPDRVTATPGQVQLGLGDGFFGDATPIFGSGSSVAAADVDGNSTMDVLVSSSSFPAGQLAVYLNSPGYDNRTGGAVGFTVSAPTQVAAGANVSVTVTAVDALGNPVPGFLGAVDLDNTPAGSTTLNLSGQYNFTAADNGKHTFLFSNLNKAGAYKLSVFAVGMPTATVPLSVVPAALNQFVIAAPATIPAGTPFSFSVTPEDKFGNIETGYTGTVHFSALANDTKAVLPPDYTFTATDNGTHPFSATLFKTTGASSPFINAKDLATGVNTSATVVVTPLAPASLSVSRLPSPYIAGTQVGVAVTAVDIYGNPANGYTGTVHFSSTDARAVLPADYTFTAADSGTHRFLVTLLTAGTRSFGVADTVNTAFASTQSGIVVVPGAASVLVFSGFSPSSVAGATETFTITAQDGFGNTAAYFGTVGFTSSDGQASLAGLYTFTAADAGSHTFTATLKTAGTQSLTAADFFTGTPSGSQSITVTPAAASSLVVGGFPATTTAGAVHSFTVSAKDAFGNVATGYTGTVTFSSSDPIASLPANYTFTAADAGTHTFTATLKRAGTQFIQASDTVTGSIIGAENGIAVGAATVSQLVLSAPANVTQGVGFKFTVSAEDAFGNVNAGYRGKVHLSSTDATGGTQDFTFSSNDNGVHVFSYTFNALGLQTLKIIDTADSTILGSAIVDVLAKSGGGGP